MAKHEKRSPARPSPHEAKTETLKEAVLPAPPGDSTATDAPFPIVGIGASAGGLESFDKFFDAMPPDTGMAFVLVQHLDPTRESHMVELLSRHTTMQVVEIADQMLVRPNTVYMIRPDRYLTLDGGILRLAPPEDAKRIYKPVDAFFRSLGEELKERSIGIILSGTGNNGTLGAQVIKANGGMVMAEDPETILHDGMPRNAIATGLVDYVLPVEKMPGVLVEYAGHPYVRDTTLPQALAERAWSDFSEILALLQERTGRDFRCYKRPTLVRRTLRRMSLSHVEEFSDYVKLLRTNPAEVKALAKDLIIIVTSFFRDPEAWEALRRDVAAPLLAGHPPELPLRAWVPGCATGEEVYSLAILLAEEAKKLGRAPEIKVFATDIDPASLEVARTGIYPESISGDVSPERLGRFFERRGDTFSVSPKIREMVTFSAHDLMTDPPFSRLDLVSCRNVLIYMEPEIQRKLMTLFQFAVIQGGYLFLGNAETVAQRGYAFEPVSTKWRIFRRLSGGRREHVEFPLVRPGEQTRAGDASRPSARRTSSLSDLMRDALVSRYAPASVLIDSKGRVVYFQGSTERFLVQPPGQTTQDLLSMAREGLRTTLRSAVQEALQSNTTITIDHARVRRGETFQRVIVEVIPQKVEADSDRLLIVTFRDEADRPSPGATSYPASAERTIAQLEEEIQVVRRELQASIAEMEDSTEQLKASNEEATSMNEELQSANEELESSKEELQSLNEELTTVNMQLQSKLTQLQEANDDLSNLFASANIATLFLDAQFRIKRFTTVIGNILGLIDADLGRPIHNIAHPFIGPDLVTAGRAVLAGKEAPAQHLQTETGQWFIRHILPYRTQAGGIEGLIVRLTDITEMKKTGEVERRLATVVRDSNDAITVRDLQGTLIGWNRGAEQMYGWPASEVLGRSVQDFVPPAMAEEVLEVNRSIAAGKGSHSFETQRRTKDGRVLDIWVTASALVDADGRPEAVAVTERDITERKQAERELTVLNETLQQQVQEGTAVAEQLRGMALQLIQSEQRERRLLAQHLHDHLQQLLAGLGFQVDILRRQLKDQKPLQTLNNIDRLVAESVEASRNLTIELSPPILYEAGLGAGLQWLARWCHAKFGLTVDLEIDSRAEPANEDIRFMLFAATRELLFNVHKHAGTKKALVQLALTEDGCIQIAVADEGTGFDGQRKDDEPSARFGLFSIRERLKALQGRMDIEGKPGVGTRVTLRLPLRQDEPPDSKPSRAAGADMGGRTRPAAIVLPPVAADDGEAVVRTGKIRVLLVDDHAVVRLGLTMLLAHEPDIEVVGEAGDGVAALDLARRLSPDVVVLDVSMPGISGLELARRMKAELPAIRIIALSMFDEREMAATMRAAGAAVYLSKTGPSEALIAAIRS